MTNESFDRLHAELAGLADEVNQVDLRDRALATSRQIGARRALAAAVVIAGVVAISAGAAFAMLPRQHVVAPAGPAPSATTPAAPPTAAPTTALPSGAPSGLPTGLPSGLPSGPASGTPTSGTLVTDPRTLKIVNATITMPAWPGFAGVCPAGTFHFTNGKATASKAAGSTYEMQYESNPASYAVGRVVYANLDGNSPDEALITVECNGDGSVNPTELLAVQLVPSGTERTLGFVVATPDHKIFDYDPLSVAVSGSTVQVQVEGDHRSNGGPLDAKQVRGYRYQNGAFRQVSGPTSFPAAPTSAAGVDIRNTTIAFPRQDCGAGCTSFPPVAIVNGAGTQNYIEKSGSGYVLDAVTYQIRSSLTMKDKSGATVALIWARVTDMNGPTDVVYVAGGTGNGNGWLMGTRITGNGQDGIKAVAGITAGTALAKVTVVTSTGTKTLTYRENANGAWVKG